MADLTLSENEQRAILANPQAIALLMIHHDVQQDQADNMGFECRGNAIRYEELKAHGRAIVEQDPDVWDDETLRAFGVTRGVTGTFNEQEKELGACSISRATIGDRTHDRGNEESHRGAGEEEQRSGEAGRRDATRAGGAELGARGGDVAQHEVSEGGGTGDGATSGAAPCPNAAHMGEHACANKAQCWEPCGELGNDERYVRAGHEDTTAINKANGVTGTFNDQQEKP